MTFPSKDLLERIELVTSIVTGLLALWPRILRKLSFLNKPVTRQILGAVALFSLGVYFGYLTYGRQWVLTNHVDGQVYDFSQGQAPTQTWCQWMMDSQPVTAEQKQKLSIRPLSFGDFLFEGKGAPRVGFLGHDSRSAGEPYGNLAIAIYNYQFPKFWKHSTATLAVKIARHTAETPGKLAIFVNNTWIGAVVLDNSSEYTLTFSSRVLIPEANNYIYIQPHFDDIPDGRTSRLVYLDSIQIRTN